MCLQSQVITPDMSLKTGVIINGFNLFKYHSLAGWSAYSQNYHTVSFKILKECTTNRRNRKGFVGNWRFQWPKQFWIPMSDVYVFFFIFCLHKETPWFVYNVDFRSCTIDNGIIWYYYNIYGILLSMNYTCWVVLIHVTRYSKSK